MSPTPGLDEAKAISMLGMVILTFFFGLMPLFLLRNSTKFLYLGNMLSAGVLLGGGLLHLLNESSCHEEGCLNVVLSPEDAEEPLPFAGFFAGFTFLVLFYLEAIVEAYMHKFHFKSNLHHHGHSHSVAGHHALDNSEEKDVKEEDKEDKEEDIELAIQDISNETKEESSSPNKPHVEGHSSLACAMSSLHLNDASMDEQADQEKKKAVLVAVVMEAALMFHSYLEGLAIGGSSDLTELVPLIVAILSHKCLVSFALGAVLLNACKETKKA